MLKIVGVILAAMVAVSASASFEIALILDRATKKVYRYDPVSGAFLGSFGSFNTPTSLSINRARNEVIVWDRDNGVNGDGIAYHYNYNTGMQTYSATALSASIAQIGFNPTGTGYISTRENVNGYYALTFGLAGGVKTMGTNAGTRFDVIDTTRFAYIEGEQKVNLVDFNASTLLNSSTPGIQPTDVATGVMSAFGGTAAAICSATGSVQLASIGSNSISYGGVTAASGFTVISGIAPTHNGFIAVGHGPSGGPLVKLFSVGIGTSLASSYLIPQSAIATSGISDPIDVVTVVAPEPETWLAMSCGVLLCLSRRRHQFSVRHSPQTLASSHSSVGASRIERNA